MELKYVLLLITSYLLGSVPTGFLLVKWRNGTDIRTVGSGNIGATNVSRVLGRNWGIFCFALDFLKGFAAACGLTFLFFGSGPEADTPRMLATVAVVSGHNWPCFLRFRGGKGMATAAGALLGMVPWVVLSCVGVWVVVILPFRMVSLSSIVASAVLPLFMWLYGKPFSYIVFGAVLAGLSLYRHRANIKRILSGTEYKIGQRIS